MAKIDVSTTSEIFPLSKTSVLLADQTKNQIVQLNVLTNKAETTWQLSTTPKAMAFDATRKLILASLEPTPFVARIELGKSDVEIIRTEGPLDQILLGPDDSFFGLLPDTQQYSPKFSVDLFNIDTGKPRKVWPPSTDAPLFQNPLIGYNSKADNLIIASSLLPGQIGQYARSSNRTYTSQLHYVPSFLSGMTQIVFSPDYKHLAFPTTLLPEGAVRDVDADNVGVALGQWTIGPLMSVGAIAFSPDSQRIAILSRSRDYSKFTIKFFDTLTRTPRGEFEFTDKGCSWGRKHERLAFSPDSTSLFYYGDCPRVGPDEKAGLILQWNVPK